MASMPKQQQGGGGHIVRPTGLTEALWACVLDDYLSEEEEGEFNRILGNKEQGPWFLRPEVVACSATQQKHITRLRRGDDPRNARARGGGDPVSFDQDQRDGTPGFWDEMSSGQDSRMPPVMWLSLPPVMKDLKHEMDWDKALAEDWETHTDWDMNVKLHRIRQQQKGKRGDVEDASTTGYQSGIGSVSRSPMLGSKTPSHISDLFPKTLSRLSFDQRSRSTKQSTSRRKSQVRNTPRMASSPNLEDRLRTRQSEASRREESRPRRQSVGKQTARKRSASPRKDSKRGKSHDFTPLTRTTSSKNESISSLRQTKNNFRYSCA